MEIVVAFAVGIVVSYKAKVVLDRKIEETKRQEEEH
jgi:hypothetical protein